MQVQNILMKQLMQLPVLFEITTVANSKHKIKLQIYIVLWNNNVESKDGFIVLSRLKIPFN